MLVNNPAFVISINFIFRMIMFSFLLIYSRLFACHLYSLSFRFLSNSIVCVMSSATSSEQVPLEKAEILEQRRILAKHKMCLCLRDVILLNEYNLMKPLIEALERNCHGDESDVLVASYMTCLEQKDIENAKIQEEMAQEARLYREAQGVDNAENNSNSQEMETDD